MNNSYKDIILDKMKNLNKIICMYGHVIFKI